ncbi:MAG: trypsin-like peptidase domain-containing protein [Planctomycetia bacterium]|nr:trypsin-like peptidase domain-containing protein [Planctomycetia bacterium]
MRLLRANVGRTVRALALATGLLVATPLLGQEPAPGTPEGGDSGQAFLASVEQSLANAIARCEPSVVSIARVRRENSDRPFAPDGGDDAFGRAFGGLPVPQPEDPNFIPNEFGTGVVIDAEGLIVTCYHVVRPDCDHWVTTRDRKTYAAKIVGADPRSDLAVLRIEATGLTPIAFGDGASVRKGQLVLALGNPYAIARDGQASVSWGIVSNLGRKSSPSLESPGETSGSLHQFGTLIQTDTRLDLGGSGGPLVNLSGEMIGLTTALAALTGHEAHAGFAIPVDDVFRRAVETMKPGREVQYGLLGVAPENLSPEDRAAGLSGALVAGVSEGTPAAIAGMEITDLVTHVDGKPIAGADELMLEIGKRDVGSEVALTVHRGGRTQELTARLTKFFMRDWRVVTAPARTWRGLAVDYANAVQGNTVFEEFGAAVRDGCVAVTEVAEGSPAWEAGFRRGDLIARIEDVSLATPDDFFAVVADRSGPVTVHLPATVAEPVARVVPEESP